MVRKEQEKVVKSILEILGIDYVLTEFTDVGFKMLLKEHVDKVLIDKVQDKMLDKGYVVVYVNKVPEKDYVSNFTVIKF